MKIQKKSLAVIAALLLLLESFGKPAVKAGSDVDTVTEAITEEGGFEEMPVFEAGLEYSPQGWIVRGVFKEFAPDTISVRPMCSTDGETYYECGQEWDLRRLGSENEDELAELWKQRCLFDKDEPLKSYLAKELDRFYIKLRIVRERGIVYETQAAVVDRGEPQSVPTEFDMAVKFAPGVSVREGRPPRIEYYGRYQITVREDAVGEEISAFLPETLPVEIQLLKGADFIGSDIVDCRVKWKALELPRLTAGESVTVLDAAEELAIPAGTVLTTQRGVYRINEPIDMKQSGITKEIRLVLNVAEKDGQPAGVLAEENCGLEMAFQLKPTGAVCIRAFTFTEGGSEWAELAGLSLTEAVNAQPLTASSGYALVLGREQEPYRSYRRAREAGEEPTPFLVGFKIEGGVYDGKQLVLAWPDTYELPPDLPQMGGSGGNEGNAGADNRGDSTEEGQRPGLPVEKPMPEPTEEPWNERPPEASEEPWNKPAPEPTKEPGGEAAPEPTKGPGGEATPEPTEGPGGEATPKPTEEPGEEPAPKPTKGPWNERPPESSEKPWKAPAPEPTKGPGGEATPEPTKGPGGEAMPEPTKGPGGEATPEPTKGPGGEATPEPTKGPGEEPAPKPTEEPGEEPAPKPTKGPGEEATPEPTEEPWNERPPESSEKPWKDPAPEPTEEPGGEAMPEPTKEPGKEPAPKPTKEPEEEPAPKPTKEPEEEPAPKPTKEPGEEPAPKPTEGPGENPTPEPTKESENKTAGRPEPEPSAGPEDKPVSDIKTDSESRLPEDGFCENGGVEQEKPERRTEHSGNKASFPLIAGAAGAFICAGIAAARSGAIRKSVNALGRIFRRK